MHSVQVTLEIDTDPPKTEATSPDGMTSVVRLDDLMGKLEHVTKTYEIPAELLE